MKKRDIIREVETLTRGIYADKDGLAARLRGLEGELVKVVGKQAEVGVGDGLNLSARLAGIESKLGWLHERVDLLATRLENMRGNVTLDDAAAKRLTFQVGQFAARLDRLEAPPAPRRPRKRPQKPAGPNGGA